MSRRRRIVFVLALILLALPAVAGGGPASGDAGSAPTGPSWGLDGWGSWGAVWAHLWSRWGPAAPGDCSVDLRGTGAVPDPPAAGSGSGGGVESQAATTTCPDPEDPACNNYPDWDPDG